MNMPQRYTSLRRAFVMCVFLFGSVISGWAQTTVYFPQTVDGAFGESFFTITIFVSNPASSGSSSVTITFTTTSGEAFDLPVVDTTGQQVNSGNTITIANLGSYNRKWCLRD